MDKNDILMSESEYEGELLSDAIKQSIRDIQTGLNMTESKLLMLIDQDIIDPVLWLSINDCNVLLLNLVKELIMICKEVKPPSAILKMAREQIQKESDYHKHLGQG